MGNQSSIPLTQVFQATDSKIQSALSSGIVGNANKAKNIAGGVTFNIPYQKSTDVTEWISNAGVGDGEVLTYNTISGPSWQPPAVLGNADKATNIAGGLQFNIPYQTAPDKTAWVTNGNANDLLQLKSTGPGWVGPLALTVGNATNATNLRAGGTASIPYQTTANVTGFLARPTVAGNFVLSNTSTSTAPAWTSATALDVKSAVNIAGGGPGTLPYQTTGNTTAQLARPTAAGNFALTISNTTMPAWVPTTTLQAGSAANNSFSIGDWKIFTEGTALCNSFQNFKTCVAPDRLSLTAAFTATLVPGTTYTLLQSQNKRYEVRFLNGSLFQYDTGLKTTRQISPASGTGPWTLAVNTATRQITLTSSGMNAAYWASPANVNAILVVIQDLPTAATPIEIQSATGLILTTV